MTQLTVARNVLNVYAADRRSLVTQAILGDIVEAEGAADDEYSSVRTRDLYQGWVRRSDLRAAMDFKTGFSKQLSVSRLFASVYAKPRKSSIQLSRLVLSTKVTIIAAAKNGFAKVLLPDGQVGFIKKNRLNRAATPVKRLDSKMAAAIAQEAVAHATTLVGTPYLWGGTTPFGIDCSGLVQLCYRLSGFEMLRDARLQINDRRLRAVGRGKSMQDAAFQPGDLLFFGEDMTKVTHVAMALDDTHIVHSAGGMGVSIEKRAGHRYAGHYLGGRRLRARPASIAKA
jgi:cell wall-associated NlpC family hydrolase